MHVIRYGTLNKRVEPASPGSCRFFFFKKKSLYGVHHRIEGRARSQTLPVRHPVQHLQSRLGWDASPYPAASLARRSSQRGLTFWRFPRHHRQHAFVPALYTAAHDRRKAFLHSFFFTSMVTALDIPDFENALH